jgi:hypothetical protein
MFDSYFCRSIANTVVDVGIKGSEALVKKRGCAMVIRKAKHQFPIDRLLHQAGDQIYRARFRRTRSHHEIPFGGKRITWRKIHGCRAILTGLSRLARI